MMPMQNGMSPNQPRPQPTPMGQGGQPGGQPPPKVADLVTEVGVGLKKVAQLFEQAGAPKEIISELNDIMNRYGALINTISGGGKATPNVAPQEAMGSKPAL
jgi:hypothetical protein